MPFSICSIHCNVRAFSDEWCKCFSTLVLTWHHSTTSPGLLHSDENQNNRICTCVWWRRRAEKAQTEQDQCGVVFFGGLTPCSVLSRAGVVHIIKRPLRRRGTCILLWRLLLEEMQPSVLFLRWISSRVSVTLKWSGVWKVVSDSQEVASNLALASDSEKIPSSQSSLIKAALRIISFGRWRRRQRCN